MDFCKRFIQFFKRIFVFLCCFCCCCCNKRNDNDRTDILPQLEEGRRTVQHGSENKRFKRFSHFYVEVTVTARTSPETDSTPNSNNSNVLTTSEVHPVLPEQIQYVDKTDNLKKSNHDNIDSIENSNLEEISSNSHQSVDNHHNATKKHSKIIHPEKTDLKDTSERSNLNTSTILCQHDDKNRHNNNFTTNNTIYPVEDHFNSPNNTIHQEENRFKTPKNITHKDEDRFETPTVIEIINPIVIPVRQTPPCVCGQHVETESPSTEHVPRLCQCNNGKHIEIRNTLVVFRITKRVTIPVKTARRHLYTEHDVFTKQKAVAITERRYSSHPRKNTVFHADKSDFCECKCYQWKGHFLSGNISKKLSLTYWISIEPVQAIQCVRLEPLCLGKRHAIFQMNGTHFPGHIYKTVIFAGL
jgi:hypothetical protein